MSPSPLPVLNAGIFCSLLGALALAVRRRDGAATVNGVVVVAVMLAPAAVEAGTVVTVHPALTAWLGIAGFLHMVGMLGVYESVSWWDHVTHTVSAALVAALCYGTLLTVGGHARVTAAFLTVGFTFAGGVFWELIELVARALGRHLDIEPVLVYYGRGDTLFDLLFDLLGAVVVVAAELDFFASLAAQAPDTAETVLLGSAAVVVAGALAMAAALTLADEWPATDAR